MDLIKSAVLLFVVSLLLSCSNSGNSDIQYGQTIKAVPQTVDTSTTEWKATVGPDSFGKSGAMMLTVTGTFHIENSGDEPRLFKDRLDAWVPSQLILHLSAPPAVASGNSRKVSVIYHERLSSSSQYKTVSIFFKQQQLFHINVAYKAS